MNRRNFLKNSVLGSIIALQHKPAHGALAPTPNEIQGPFYPVVAQQDKDFDLTHIQGRSDSALGQHVVITGHVLDANGAPVENATVDIWQANAAGKYRHPHDPNPAPIDENFQGWGIILTEKDGSFRFKTVLPGAYPVNRSWTRPPHIHFKVTKRGYVELITQMYFPNQALNKVDKLLQRKSPDEQALMIAKESSSAPGTYYYPIHIEKL